MPGLISYAYLRQMPGRGTKERVLDPLVMSAVSAEGGNSGTMMSALEWRQQQERVPVGLKQNLPWPGR